MNVEGRRGEGRRRDADRLAWWRAQIPFEVKNADEHYHIPLLLSPYAYSTYRGS